MDYRYRGAVGHVKASVAAEPPRLTMEILKQMGDDARVSIAARPLHSWDGKRLEPRLWEALRVEFQDRYRRATGEEFATLTVDNNPRETA